MAFIKEETHKNITILHEALILYTQWYIVSRDDVVGVAYNCLTQLVHTKNNEEY